MTSDGNSGPGEDPGDPLPGGVLEEGGVELGPVAAVHAHVDGHAVHHAHRGWHGGCGRRRHGRVVRGRAAHDDDEGLLLVMG